MKRALRGRQEGLGDRKTELRAGRGPCLGEAAVPLALSPCHILRSPAQG